MKSDLRTLGSAAGYVTSLHHSLWLIAPIHTSNPSSSESLKATFHRSSVGQPDSLEASRRPKCSLLATHNLYRLDSRV